jgi:hypothetical protein
MNASGGGRNRAGKRAIEWRYADAQFSRAVELVAELVGLQVDIIAAYHTPAVKAAEMRQPRR